MSSHYFVKEHQEYSAVFLGIPKNEVWQEYMAWQPYVICFEKAAIGLKMENIDMDELWIPPGHTSPMVHGERGETKVFTYPDLFNGVKTLVEKHPNPSLLFFVDDPRELKTWLLEMDLRERSIEIISSLQRDLLLQKTTKKWFAPKTTLEWPGQIKSPEGKIMEYSKGFLKIGEEGLYEFEDPKPGWLSIRFQFAKN